jgi:hypothetical protein
VGDVSIGDLNSDLPLAPKKSGTVNQNDSLKNKVKHSFEMSSVFTFDNNLLADKMSTNS